MNNKRQRNKLLTMLLLVILVPCIAWAHEGSYDDNGFCTDEDCSEKYEPAAKRNGWYEISNAGQLYWFAEQVDNGNTNLINANVRLTNDIIDNDVTFSYDAENDYAPVAIDANGKNVDVNTLRVWNPIGIFDGVVSNGGGELADENYSNKQKWFGGHFDGQGFSITGLYFNDINTHNSRGGLFANLRYTAIIENIKIDNCFFKGKTVGSIAAYIEGSSINSCYSNCIICGLSYAGGILGQGRSRYYSKSEGLKEINIYNCVNKGTVIGCYAGGIIGWARETYHDGKLSCLINVGNMIGRDYASNIASFVGEFIGSISSKYTLKCCFGHNPNMSLIGEKDSGVNPTITKSKILPIADFHNGNVAYILSFIDENWGQNLSQSESFPTYKGTKVYKLCGEYYTNDVNAIAEHSWEEGVCTKCDDKQEANFNTDKNSYEISNLGQLLWFDEWFGENGLKWDENTNAHLTTDITINKETLDYDGKQNKVLVNGETDKESSLKTWKTLGKTHTIEGNGHTISGFYGETFGDGNIQNLTIKNAVVIDYGAFGGEGSVTNCHFKGVVKTMGNGGGFTYSTSTSSIISNCSFEGRFYGSDDKTNNAGGFVGCNWGTIKDCSFIGDCFNLQGEIARIRFAGGNRNKIENCYSSIFASNQDSELEKKTFLVATYNHGTIQNVAYDKDKLTLNDVQSSSAYSTIENVIGYTTEQIKSGEVTYWLNDNKSDGTQAWYQKLGENGDAYPLLTATDDNTVYHGTKCDKETDVYTNDNSIFGEDGAIPHNYEITNVVDGNGLYGGVCTECNASNESIKYIHDFCGEKGRDIKLTVASDGSYSTTETVTLADGAAYNSPVNFTAAKVEYTRNYLGADLWQAVYVPFETQATDWTNNDITVASINNFHEYETEDGSGYETVLEVKKATSGEFEANTPYVLRTSESGSKTITITNVKLHKAASETYYCMSMTRKYDFTGIYTPQSGLGQDDISAVYTLDKQGRMAPLRPATTLGAQRWYLTVSNRNGSSLSQESKSRTIRIDEIGEGAITGIEGIQVITSKEADSTSQTGVYDLQGRKLSKEPNHGIYIKNGKKYVK